MLNTLRNVLNPYLMPKSVALAVCVCVCVCWCVCCIWVCIRVRDLGPWTLGLKPKHIWAWAGWHLGPGTGRIWARDQITFSPRAKLHLDVEPNTIWVRAES